MKMKHINKLISLILCFAILPMCFFAANAETDGVLYTDVPENAWYTEAVYDVTANGLMNGFGDSFKPNETLTRAQAATLIWRLAGSPPTFEDNDVVGGENAGYADIDYKNPSWYFQAVIWCRNESIMKGYVLPGHYDPAGQLIIEWRAYEFRPDQALTREEFAAMIYRFVDDNLDHFTGLGIYEDCEDVSNWAYQALSWCTAREIIMGTNENGPIYLYPKAEITRAEAAMIFMRLSRWMEQQQKPE